jgi:hypothetical protein
MLEDPARATRYEIDKARDIINGLVGWQKDRSLTNSGSSRPLLPGACRRQCRIDTPCFLRKNKVGGGDPDRTGDPRLMSSSEIISLAKKPQ